MLIAVCQFFKERLVKLPYQVPIVNNIVSSCRVFMALFDRISRARRVYRSYEVLGSGSGLGATSPNAAIKIGFLL